MRVILIRPPRSYNDANSITKLEVMQPPIGISLIASFLRQYGQEVKIIDMMQGIRSGDLENLLSEYSADVVGISCLSGQHFDSFKLAKLAKKRMRPSPKVILGGPHPSAADMDEKILLYCPEIDFIVRGEGEETVRELLETIENNGEIKKVKGITFRQPDGKIFRTSDREAIKDLDALPFPDYSDFDFEAGSSFYDGHLNMKRMLKTTESLRYAPILTSRGCPNRCVFCALFWGNKVRFRSVENVVSEISMLYQQKNIRHFSIVDDCFNISLSRVQRFCRLLLEKKLPITWSAVARVYPLDESTLKMMKEAGCLGLDFGVESGSEIMLRKINKNITLENIVRAFDLTKKTGILATALLMVGNPGEEKQTISGTIRFLKRCKPDAISVSPATILPDTGLYKLALEKGIITEDYWIHNSTLPFYTAEHTSDELRLYRLRILFYQYIIQRNFKMLSKVLVLIIGSWLIIKFGLQIDSVRNFCLSKPILKSVLRRFSTV